MNIEEGLAGERERMPPGDWVEEGGSEFRKEAGEEGGTMNGRVIVCVAVGFCGTEGFGLEGVGSGANDA